jgi:hypothetical protein
MTSDPYRSPAAKVADLPYDGLPSPAPLGVRIAIIISWLVLAIESFDGLWKIYADAEASADLQFKYFWIAVTLTSTAVTALFIFQASRGRNWGRIGLLIWTLGSWGLWIIYPQRIEEYTWWKWLISGLLIAMELTALFLLFRGNGAKWYSTASSRGTSAL